MKPAILMPDFGRHNADLEASRARVLKGQSYRDLSTICLIPLHPGREGIAPRVVQSWMGLLTPMNQKFCRLFLQNMEVGDAYSQALDMIFAHPDLSAWKYVLTLEDDNIPPADGLLQLYESLEEGGYGAVGGLYWTKGPGGAPMCYGRPDEMPRTFAPQPPIPDAVQPCNGLGMGFTLFRMSMLKDARLPRPLFKTQQGLGLGSMTQDLYFFNNARELGYTIASDNRVRVGHYDAREDIVW